MRNAYHLVVPTQAGIQGSARRMFPEWRDFRRALLKVLCLADPWVPAFAGTTMEQSAGMETEMVEN